MSRFSWRDGAALALLLLGSTQMAGDLLGNRMLKGIGAASAMAPCPKVFCEVRGLEGFASNFTLRLETSSGRIREVTITPELYARLRGPYNRRNAYGAAISFAPKLPESLWRSVYDYGWRKDGPLRREWGVPNDIAEVTTVRAHCHPRPTGLLDAKEPERTMTEISGKRFAIFRIALGSYLAIHFAQLLPYGRELFSNRGMLADARLNLTFGIFPNPLVCWDSPACVGVFLAALTFLSIAFAAGIRRRLAAILLWFGWACLFNRNNLILNPSIPYIGLLLLLSALVPPGEGWSMEKERPGWIFPASVYWTAWILLAAGYSYSGWMKLLSPSWIDGSALLHILQNPLARPGPLRDALLRAPAFSFANRDLAGPRCRTAFSPVEFLPNDARDRLARALRFADRHS